MSRLEVWKGQYYFFLIFFCVVLIYKAFAHIIVLFPMVFWMSLSNLLDSRTLLKFPRDTAKKSRFLFLLNNCFSFIAQSRSSLFAGWYFHYEFFKRTHTISQFSIECCQIHEPVWKICLFPFIFLSLFSQAWEPPGFGLVCSHFNSITTFIPAFNLGRNLFFFSATPIRNVLW